MRDAAFESISTLSRAIASGELDPAGLTDIHLDRISRLNGTLNAYVAVAEGSARQEAAAAADRARRHARLGPLDGIPVALKDNIDAAGLPTSNGFGGPHPAATQDSEVVRRLRVAGAVILGKLNMQEGALGAVNDNAHFGPTHNPWRFGFTPGGSSGGSAVAVAAGLCAVALGTDTGGSVRIPASYCGLVGFKPSYGLISTRGVVPLCHRLDHVGVLARSATDAAVVVETLAGFDAGCMESRRHDVITLADPPASLAGLRLGVVTSLDRLPVQDEVRSAFAKACADLAHLGAAVTPIDIDGLEPIALRRAVFVAVEVGAALVHAELRSRAPQRLSPEMRAFIDWGAKASAVHLLKAERVIEAAAFGLFKAWRDVDAVISPATPQAAFPFGATVPDDQGAFCVLANAAGCPAISVPMGLDRDGLPLGLQIITPVGCDARAVAIAHLYAQRSRALFPPPPFGPLPHRSP